MHKRWRAIIPRLWISYAAELLRYALGSYAADVMLSEVRFVLLQGNICPDFYALEIGSAAACHHFQGPRHTQARHLFLQLRIFIAAETHTA